MQEQRWRDKNSQTKCARKKKKKIKQQIRLFIYEWKKKFLCRASRQPSSLQYSVRGVRKRRKIAGVDRSSGRQWITKKNTWRRVNTLSMKSKKRYCESIHMNAGYLAKCPNEKKTKSKGNINKTFWLLLLLFCVPNFVPFSLSVFPAFFPFARLLFAIAMVNSVRLAPYQTPTTIYTGNVFVRDMRCCCCWSLILVPLLAKAHAFCRERQCEKFQNGIQYVRTNTILMKQ